MSYDPRQHFERIQRSLQQRGGAGFGGGMPGGGAAGRGVVGLILLGVGGAIVSNSLFNVEGGHRAIAYSRFSGVKPQIYNEGMRTLCDIGFRH